MIRIRGTSSLVLCTLSPRMSRPGIAAPIVLLYPFWPMMDEKISSLPQKAAGANGSRRYPFLDSCQWKERGHWLYDDDRRVSMDEGPAIEIRTMMTPQINILVLLIPRLRNRSRQGAFTGESEDVLHLDGVASISALCGVCFTPRVVGPISI